MRIFLIGFMGCGKSYLGKKIADRLGFKYVDLDSVIENTEGVTIAQIFENKGETYFRKLESECLKILNNEMNIVIATGGGTPCFHDNMAFMNEKGKTIYLKTSPQLLLKRLIKEAEHRPLLRGKTETELLYFIKTKVAEREQFYNQAHVIAKQTKDFEEKDIAKIISKLKNQI